MRIEDKSLKGARRKFLVSLLFLIAGLVYLISPIDLIPDILGPFGWIDDLMVLLGVFLYSAWSYHRMKKAAGGRPRA